MNVYRVTVRIQRDEHDVSFTAEKTVVARSLIGAMGAAVRAARAQHMGYNVTVSHVVEIASNVLLDE